MALTFKSHVLALLHALKLFEDGKLALTNLLMVTFGLAFIRFRDPDWTVLVGLGLILLSYNYKRYLSSKTELAKFVIDTRHDEAMKKLSDHVRSIENQLALSSRGY